jgi:hypothetical protein
MVAGRPGQRQGIQSSKKTDYQILKAAFLWAAFFCENQFYNIIITEIE